MQKTRRKFRGLQLTAIKAAARRLELLMKWDERRPWKRVLMDEDTAKAKELVQNPRLKREFAQRLDEREYVRLFVLLSG